MPLGKSQKAWLSAAKRSLSKTRPSLTWDKFADLAGIDRRAFKSYRMPEGSADYRNMPPLAESAIKSLLEKPPKPVAGIEAQPAPAFSLVIPALAALVIRQARTSLIEGRMIAGISRSPGLPIGLMPEDRKAMALVSRASLVHGLTDNGAEIHELLAKCTRPLGEWLQIPEVEEAGLGGTYLIHGDDGIPTLEAEELAAGFGTLSAGIEEQLFLKLMEVLGRFPDERADEYYTAVREFVVRHPIARGESLNETRVELPAQVWNLLQQQFYEPVPESWEVGGVVPLCAHCNNAMRKGASGGLVCRTAACAATHPASSRGSARASELIRVTRGVRQYWVEPGIDEICLHDALVGMGLSVKLYPNRDRVDLAVGETGIDLKAYASPETLGRRFKRSIGGLAFYPRKWVLVPDWIIGPTPTYLDRLKAAAQRDEVEFMPVSQALRRLARASSHA